MFWLGLTVGLIGPYVIWLAVYSVYWAVSPTGRWHECVFGDYATADRATNAQRYFGWLWHKLTRVPDKQHQAVIAAVRAERAARLSR